MIRSLFLIAAFLFMYGLGFSAPFVFTLGYEWVDLVRPENIAFGLLKGIPFAFIMGSTAFGAYMFLDRQYVPRIGMVTLLTLLFALWITLSTAMWAVLPDFAWIKWDWAFKTMVFSAFIPFVIRSRIQIEAFILVYIFSLAANIVPFGAKTLLTGGGYGHALGLMNRNFFLGEGSTLATAALLIIPFIFFAMKHSQILPRWKLTTLGFIGLTVLSLATAIGTHERTALVGMAVLAMSCWILSRHKILFGAICVAAGFTVMAAAPTAWIERMQTISANPQDPSALTRFAVWAWTYNYVKEHPLGGGFDVYRINQITIPATEETGSTELVQNARAFHSSIFEVLGEQGWVGFGIFMTLILWTVSSLFRTALLTRRRPEFLWVYDLACALLSSMAVLGACFLFIGIAFQPFLYYSIALAFSLKEYLRRATTETMSESRQTQQFIPANA